MDFNKIEEVIKNRNYSLKYFIPKYSGMKVDGFRLAVQNKTLKVVVLEAISKALELPMSFWWEDELNIINDKNISYEKKKEIEINKLKQELSIGKETVKHLNIMLRQYTKAEETKPEKEKLVASGT